MLQLLKFQSALPHSIVILNLLICNPSLVTHLSFGLRLKRYNDQSAEISKSLNKHYYNPTKGILMVKYHSCQWSNTRTPWQLALNPHNSWKQPVMIKNEMLNGSLPVPKIFPPNLLLDKNLFPNTLTWSPV